MIRCCGRVGYALGTEADNVMAEIRPFRGIRYDASQRDGHDISALLAPPYDVLSEQERDGLLAQDRRNIVALDLPHMPPGFAGPLEAYAGAAEALEAWRSEGILIQEERPSVYVYHQVFDHAGRAVTRRMFFARLRLEEFGRGSVYPHERTFGGPKEDRLMLTRATRCNLSPIFGLYPDASNEVAGILDVANRPPVAEGTLDGVGNRLWVVDDTNTIDRVASAMHDKAVFIADGHHRYGTALMYRDEVAAENASLPDDHPANFVLVVLCAMEDPGLLILPTHRLLLGLKASDAITSLQAAEGIEMIPSEAGPDEPIEPGTFRVFAGDAEEVHLLRLDGPAILARLEPDRSDAWRRLDVAVLHRYLLDEVVSPADASGAEPEIRYIKNAAAGRDEARRRGGVQIEMAPTSLADMREVCRAGELMPQKSTFFYPKLATGLVINPLQ